MSQQKKDTEISNKKNNETTVIVNQARVRIPMETVPIPPPEFVELPLPEFVPIKIDTIKTNYQPIMYEVPVEEYKPASPRASTPVELNTIKTEYQPTQDNASVEENETLPEIFEYQTYEQMLGVTEPDPLLKHYISLLRKFDQKDRQNKKHPIRIRHKINIEDIALKTLIFVIIILFLFSIIAIIHTQILLLMK
jgi:hypothetical protein